MSAQPIVTERAFEKAPVTPLRKLRGMKTMSVARLEPVSGVMNSRAAAITAVLPVGSSPRAPSGRGAALRDMFDHDNGVIDHKADRRGDAAERHNIESQL